MARDGSVGQATYEAVTRLEGEGKTRQEAFEAVAAEREQQVGTVSANYYRVARKNGAKPRRAARSPQRVVLASTHPAPVKYHDPAAETLYACIEKMVDDAVDRRLQRLLG